MAGSQLSVSNPDVANAIMAFEQASQECSANLAGVNEQFLRLQAVWIGQDEKQFGQAMDKWESDFSYVIKQFDDMIEKLGASNTEYVNSETNAQQLAPKFSTMPL